MRKQELTHLWWRWICNLNAYYTVPPQKSRCPRPSPIPACAFETDELDAVIVAALLTTHALVHNGAPAAPATPVVKVKRAKKHSVSSGAQVRTRCNFCEAWKYYVEATKVAGKELVIQLLEWCDENLRRDLTRSAGGSLADKSQEDVLKAIRILAVREENTMVARVMLNNMTQGREEIIRLFGASLRGQAGWLVVLRLNVPVNNFSVMSGRSHRFLGN